MQNFSYKNELLRKTIHLSSLLYPLIYLFTTKTFALIVISIALCVVLFWETLRIKKYNTPFLNLITKTLRKEEIENTKILGAIPFLLSSLIVVMFFSKHIAILSMLVLIFCDTAAAIVGKKAPLVFFKKYNKSLGGCIAYIVCGFVVVTIYIKANALGLNFYHAALMAVFASSFAELISNKVRIDDNISITITFALIVSILS